MDNSDRFSPACFGLFLLKVMAERGARWLLFFSTLASSLVAADKADKGKFHSFSLSFPLYLPLFSLSLSRFPQWVRVY